MLWGGQFQNAYMDATKGGPDGIMWSVSAGGHHLWASSTTQSFTMANPAITYQQGKKNALKALENSGMMAGTLAAGAGPGSTTGPGGGGGCWPYSSNPYVDGQGWSDCTEESEPAAYAQIVSDPQIHQGQYTLFNYRVWWANSFATSTNSDFYVTQAYMSADNGQPQVFEQQLYPYTHGSGNTWSFSVGYDGFNVTYYLGTASTQSMGDATNWTVTESGKWSPGPKQYSSDSTGNGFASRIELYANSDQPTGWYSGTATARLQYWSPFESYWTSNASFPWTYEVVP